MLDLQREREYERWRLMTKQGMSAEEADAIVHAEKHPFKPAYPREESKRTKADDSKPTQEDQR